MACDTTAFSGVACHARWEFIPQLCHDMDIKNVKRCSVKSTSRLSLRWLLCSCFALLFFSSIYFASKGGYCTYNYKPKCPKEWLLTNMPQPLCYSQTQLVPVAALWFSRSSSWGDTYWLCYLSVNDPSFLLCDYLAKSQNQCSKKSN